nr:GDSL-type esterase/lipase family protein [Streptococcus lutetiensis]
MTDFQELYHKADVTEFRNKVLADQQVQLWEKYDALNQLVKQPNIVFAGDSITEYFPIHEMLKSDFPLYNRGVHGINSLQLLEHLHTQVLDLRPSKVVLLIGVNDLKTRQPEEVCETIETIMTAIHQKLPETQIILLSVFPMNESPRFVRTPSHRNNDSINQLNNLLSNLSKEGVTYLNIHDSLCDESGQLPLTCTVDGLHLNVDGYRVVSEILSAYL